MFRWPWFVVLLFLLAHLAARAKFLGNFIYCKNNSKKQNIHHRQQYYDARHVSSFSLVVREQYDI